MADSTNAPLVLQAKQPEGKTALMLAAWSGHTAVVTTLLEQGANIDAVDANHNTALHCASFCGHLEVVKVLADFGANLNCVTKAGHTALHVASYNNKFDIVELLVQRGADVNIQTTNGRTALACACLNGYDQIALFLLDHGARMYPDCTGCTPLHMAAIKDRRETVDLLLQRGGCLFATNNRGEDVPTYVQVHVPIQKTMIKYLMDKRRLILRRTTVMMSNRPESPLYRLPHNLVINIGKMI